MHETVSPALRRLLRATEHALEAPSEDEIARATLMPIPKERMKGCSEKLFVQDEDGRCYVFKVPPPHRFALEAELFATAVRRGCGHPSVSNVAQRLRIGGRIVEGFVKPWVENRGVLGQNPMRWTELQRTAVLVDHAYAELCGNYDTKPGQYVLIGDAATNIDWDHALRDHARNPAAHRQPLSRHKKDKPSPPAQQILWWAFVRDSIDVDESPLHETLASIAELDDDLVVHALQPFIRRAFAGGARFGPFGAPAELVDVVLHRKHALTGTFERFLADVHRERDLAARRRARGFGFAEPFLQPLDLDLAVLRRMFASPRFHHVCVAAQRLRSVARRVA